MFNTCVHISDCEIILLFKPAYNIIGTNYELQQLMKTNT